MSGTPVLTRLKVEDGNLTAERWQDCEDIVERNKLLQNIPQKSDWGRHTATIPNVILEKWLNEEWARGNTELKMSGPEFDRIIQQKLNDPDWRWLRVDK